MNVSKMTDDELAAALQAAIAATDVPAFRRITSERRRRFVEAVIAPRQRGEVQKPPWCLCDDGYWLRGRDDPLCRHSDVEELLEALEEALGLVESPPEHLSARLREWRTQ